MNTGPICPECLAGDSTVATSRKYREYQIRRRLCGNCGEEFTTYESTKDIAGVPPRQRSAIQKARDLLESCL